MSTSYHPEFSLTPGTFSLYIAPSEIIRKALSILLSRQQTETIYLCGNYPTVLPGLPTQKSRIRVRRALTVYQVLTILEESYEPLILFEHDRTLFDDNAEPLLTLGELIRKKASDNQTVCLFSLHLDQWIIQIEPFANRIMHLIANKPPVQKVRVLSSSNQMDLTGYW